MKDTPPERRGPAPEGQALLRHELLVTSPIWPRLALGVEAGELLSARTTRLGIAHPLGQGLWLSSRDSLASSPAAHNHERIAPSISVNLPTPQSLSNRLARKAYRV
jgi:hypothetical protein